LQLLVANSRLPETRAGTAGFGLAAETAKPVCRRYYLRARQIPLAAVAELPRLPAVRVYNRESKNGEEFMYPGLIPIPAWMLAAVATAGMAAEPVQVYIVNEDPARLLRHQRYIN